VATPDELTTAAMELVHKLLTRRLSRSGVSTSRPDFYFQCQADAPRAYPGGIQVRIRIWRHWSDAWVQLEADQGALMGWRIDRYADPPTDTEMTQEDIQALAQTAIEIPHGAEVESFSHYDFAPGWRVTRIQWRHMHDGLRVEGDYLWVVIHPQTKRIIEWACKWRAVRVSH
jgi:hypothetical protein